ncbi:MAG TPA: ATP-binding protein [Azospirillaceae bacterium]|nr:ATP-binding protein [Azospirillaceae bacterium]
MFRVSARTVLELGVELISSDIIAFYELVKNAFDAKSKSGADIRFRVVLRRNVYHVLRNQALLAQTKFDKEPNAEHEGQAVAQLTEQVRRALDVTAGNDLVSAFGSALGSPTTLSAFIERFERAYRTFNTIEVSDTGTGMSLSDLQDHYLLIGTPSRKRDVEAAVAGGGDSPYLGEKGLGRLSAMRLGQSLSVQTARAEDAKFNLLDIDWQRFEDVEAMIEDIKVKPRVGDPKPSSSWSGTKLTIGALTEDWTANRVRSMCEIDFARLLDPFIDARERPRIAIYWNGNRLSIPTLDHLLLDHAHASFKGRYAIEEGKPVLYCTIQVNDLGFDHPREIETVCLTLPDLIGSVIGTSQELPVDALMTVGPFAFEGYWYNRRRLGRIDSIGDQKAVRDLQRKWSGIMLFRDRFRVFPYGDESDDWLALDRKALGRPGYALNKTQFVGRVNIGRAPNPFLVDQTNREGLRQTPEEQVLIALLQHVIQGLLWDFLREVERRHKRQPIDLSELRTEAAGLEGRAKRAITQLKNVVTGPDRALVDELHDAIQEYQVLAERAQKKISEVEADSRQMVHMAGVGLMVEVVAHELARAAEAALKAVEALKGSPLPPEVKARVETLSVEMKNISKRLKVLDPLSVSGRHNAETFDLVQLVSDLREGHASEFGRLNLEFRVEAPSGPVRVRTFKGMIVQILENLISNSVYWVQIRGAKDARYTPQIVLTIEADPPSVTLRDNGTGIAPENAERIFRPFWSLKEKARRRGLGLFIASENAAYIGATLTLSKEPDPATGRLHEFVLELPNEAAVR